MIDGFFLNGWLDEQSGKEVLVVSDNEELRRRLSEKALPRPLTMQVPVEGNYFAQVSFRCFSPIMIPPDIGNDVSEWVSNDCVAADGTWWSFDAFYGLGASVSAALTQQEQGLQVPAARLCVTHLIHSLLLIDSSLLESPSYQIPFRSLSDPFQITYRWSICYLKSVMCQELFLRVLLKNDCGWQLRGSSIPASVGPFPRGLGHPPVVVERRHLRCDRRSRLRFPGRQDAPWDLPSDGHRGNSGSDRSHQVSLRFYDFHFDINIFKFYFYEFVSSYFSRWRSWVVFSAVLNIRWIIRTVLMWIDWWTQWRTGQ